MKRETFLSKAGNTRNIWLLGFVVVVGGSAAFALDPLGPPTAGLRKGQFKESVEYSYGTMDFKLNEGKWIEHLDGVFFDSGKATSLTLKDFKTNKAYFNLGYGITDDLDAFLRLGATTATFGDSIWEDTEKFDNHADFTVGCGIKGIMEIQVAVGPTYKLADRISIYGGPFLHFIVGDLDDEFSEASGGGLLTSIYSWDVDESSMFGGYIGAQVEIAENSSFGIEYQHTAAADALVVRLLWRF